MDKFPMTPAGHRQLQDQVRQLRAKDLPAAVKAVEEALSHGDLSENAELDVARDAQAKLNKQINDLENALSQAQIIDPSLMTHDKVTFGATVKLQDLDTDDVITYQIVGIHESNVTAGKVSIESPIARGLLGKAMGDNATVRTPKGTREFEILEISFT